MHIYKTLICHLSVLLSCCCSGSFVTSVSMSYTTLFKPTNSAVPRSTQVRSLALQQKCASYQQQSLPILLVNNIVKGN
jgi:hypothetical protein